MTSPDGCICTYHEHGDGTYTRTAHKDCKAKHFAFEAKIELATHPPLCPETPDRFWYDSSEKQGLTCELGSCDYFLRSVYSDDRRFIARYQACAWLDLAIEWESKAHSPHCVAREEAVRCEKNYHAWRDWEKLP